MFYSLLRLVAVLWLLLEQLHPAILKNDIGFPAIRRIDNHDDVIAALDEATASGAAPSKNALVERALVKELRELRRQMRQEQWQEGAKDPLLLKDISEVEASFQFADAETAGRMG